MTRRSRIAAGVAILAAALGAAGQAQAATTYGSNLSTAPVDTFCGGAACTLAQVALPASAQAPGGVFVSTGGVIVRWRMRTGGASGSSQVRLRTLSGNTAIASSSVEVLPGAPGIYEYAARIPVGPGSRLGVTLESSPLGGVDVVRGGGPAMIDDWSPPSLVDGETRAPNSTLAGEVVINADVEPDADNDGYGDETQDCNPASAAATTDCAPPDVTITNGPKDKTKRKTATFEFTGTDARAVAGFECSLDGGAFTACTSPHTVKVKKGKHTFSVRAVDDSGNADASPATDDWKVKKKRRK